MHRRPRSIASFTLAVLIAALLAACGGPTGTPDPTGPGEGEPEPYWEMVVTSGSDEPFEVSGTAVAYASPNVIVLGASDPAGWSVRFTITGDLGIGIPYVADNDDLLNATVGTPTGSDCVVTPSSTHAGITFVTLGPPEGDVPTGIGNVTVDGGCGTFTAVTGFVIGFGVQ
jgi:hypothetical protein